MINLFDSHVHSDNSPDGSHRITLLCETAVERGFSGISITDHCETNEYEKGQFELRMKQSIFETRMARHIFHGKLSVSIGIELGQPMDNLLIADRALNLGDYDFILAAHHGLLGMGDFCNMDFSQVDVYPMLDRYYQQLYDVASWGGFHVLAHMTYPLRYITGIQGIPVDMDRYDEVIDEILRVLAQNGKGLELNVSGLRHPLGDTIPNIRYFKRFRELGGEAVTIGSDAHRAEEVGLCIADGMELLESVGYRYFSFYRRGKPIQLRIV